MSNEELNPDLRQTDVSSRSIDDVKRICQWYVEWTNNREKNGVELFGFDYELKYAAERVLSELNGC